MRLYLFFNPSQVFFENVKSSAVGHFIDKDNKDISGEKLLNFTKLLTMQDKKCVVIQENLHTELGYPETSEYYVQSIDVREDTKLFEALTSNKLDKAEVWIIHHRNNIENTSNFILVDNYKDVFSTCGNMRIAYDKKSGIGASSQDIFGNCYLVRKVVLGLCEPFNLADIDSIDSFYIFWNMMTRQSKGYSHDINIAREIVKLAGNYTNIKVYKLIRKNKKVPLEDCLKSLDYVFPDVSMETNSLGVEVTIEVLAKWRLLR